jgi:hypothetical protein
MCRRRDVPLSALDSTGPSSNSPRAAVRRRYLPNRWAGLQKSARYSTAAEPAANNLALMIVMHNKVGHHVALLQPRPTDLIHELIVVVR